MGAFLAAANDIFDWMIFGLCALTTTLLQILSNLANDYGDSIHGADHADRQGPKRTVQSGAISLNAMKRALVICAVLAFASGIALLLVAFQDFGQIFWVFLGLGLLAIGAAVTYTAGWRPYGYAGLGDLSVLVFFGWLAVLGSYFLFDQQLDWRLILPATSIGLLSVGVLNVNNIRDIESDRKAGKYSIPVRLGRSKAVVYHQGLLVTAILASVAYVTLVFESPLQFLFLLVMPLLLINIKAVKNKTSAAALDPYLKQLALTSLLFVLLFGLGQLI
jgi:1,4-dihydroxy-2-naphthoate octaprenyltransferase